MSGPLSRALAGLLFVLMLVPGISAASDDGMLVPDSAHGTNPATAAMCGYQVVNIPSAADGCVTVRDRDTMEQVRIHQDELPAFLAEKMEF